MTERTVELLPNAGWDQRIRVFQYGRLVTSFAVISERYVVLIDTLINVATAEALLSAVADALPGRQLLAINTHADWDHSWGNAAFAGPDALHQAPIIGHQRCRERLLAAEAQQELAQMQQRDPELFTGLRIQPPTLTFNDHLTIDGGDLRFELLRTPGHQPDHISIWLPELRAVFTGDAAELPLPFISNPATLPELRVSQVRLLALEPERAFHCHAHKITRAGSPGLQVLRDNIAYFDDLEGRVRTALSAGRLPQQPAVEDVETLVDFPYEQVPGLALLDDEERAAYRENHRSAIAAMIGNVRAATG
jgi:glyoxylase-like metal-dependent hydrolase (beta-lactamase superfamily II)